jgi:phage/plasmid-like protein (TIGR03299 family)
MAANVESMMWVGDFTKDMPWHMNPEKFYGYGGASPLSAAETVRLSGLDWRVGLHPAAVEIGGRVFKSEELLHIVRDRDNKILGTCTERYTPIQNSEAFNFLDSAVGELSQLRYVTAGSIDGGKRIWLLAQLLGDGYELEPILGDKTKMFLMLTTGHDGNNSLKCKFTSVRIVCQNTLNLALRTGEDGVTIKHVGDPTRKIQQAREILGLASEEAEQFRRISTWLAGLRADAAYTRDFLETMAPTEGKGPKAVTRAENIQKEILHLSMMGKGTHIPGVTGTRWALLNAVTEYNTHERNYRNTEQSGADTNKFDALFGGGVAEKMNQKALDFLLADAPDAVYKAPKRSRELELA